MAITIEKLEREVAGLVSSFPDDWKLSACGVTRSERQIPALVDHEAYEPVSDRVRVLLVGGLSGMPDDVAVAMEGLRHFPVGRYRDGFALSAVPCANPGGLALRTGPANGAGGSVVGDYPPAGGFYDHPTSPESRYLWRWTCYQAPDIVLELRHGSETHWEANEAAGPLREALGAGAATSHDSFIAALGRDAADSPGTIPGVRLTVNEDSVDKEFVRFFEAVTPNPPGPSAAREALDWRRDRSLFEVGRDLARTNGRTLDPLVYMQGVAISGRLRLALLNPAEAGSVDDVASLVEPAVAVPRRAFSAAPEAPELAAIVWAEEMAALTGDRRYGDALVAAMTYFKARGPGEPPAPLNPNFIVEDYFFASAVIGRGAPVIGDTNASSYMAALTEFLLNAGIQEENGLFRHSRYGAVHWGRGNGFAAMGLAECLTYMPQTWPDRSELIDMFARHMEALRPLQEPSGMYLQVVDFLGSYQELTATCMIGYAMARGIRLGLLDDSYRQTVELAWHAASERIDALGNVVDGCTGTGVMDGLRSYLDRPANSGYDDRTGSMALWFTAEMARLKSET